MGEEVKMKGNTSQTQTKDSTPPRQPKTKQQRAKDPHKPASGEVALPLAEGAECEVLGLIIMDGVDMLQKAVEAGLTVNLFQIQSHKMFFNALTDMKARGWDINPKTLEDHLTGLHQLDKVGGPAYIAQLVSGRAPGPSTVPGLIRQLQDIDYKRQAAKKAETLLRLAGNGASPAEIEEFLDSIPRSQTIKQSYYITSSGIWWRKPGRYGLESEQVTNFCAKIVSEVIADDGSSEEQRIFELEVAVKGETRRIEVPASKFGGMAWVTAQLGAEADVCPGKENHARYAIKQLSPSFTKRVVYAHTGWRQIGDDWCYLHGAGGVTGEGNRTDIAVRLPHSLRHFLIPDPPKGDGIMKAYGFALKFLDAFPRSLTAPLLGSVWASALGEIDYSVYVVGQSGVFKSELTALIASFFGAGFNRLTMAANWDDTANVLLSKLFTAKDGVLVIDDFAPNGNKKHDEDLHAKAERVFRAAGNRTGRGRLQSDMTERLAKEPRGLLISSGEDLPRGMSLQARLHIVSIEKGMITSEALTKMQRSAAKGELAASFATFLSHLARDREKIKSEFDKERVALREKLSKTSQRQKGHAREVTTTAHLGASWKIWIRSAVAEKAITKGEGETLWNEIWKTLAEAGQDQQAQQASQHPADHFIDLLKSALISGRANLQTIEGGQPSKLGHLCGWRDGKPTGECVGWVEDSILYLEMKSAYGVANAQGYRNGEGIAVVESTLVKRLDERGLIAVKEKGRGYKTRTPRTRIDSVAVLLSLLFDEGN
jgi:DnaB-like helicase N terminal domain